MKKMLSLALLIFVFGINAYSQTAEEYIKKAAQIWGDSKVDTAQTLKIEAAKIDEETGADHPLTLFFKDDKARAEFINENQKIIITCNGKKGWAKSNKGVEEIPSDQAKYVIPQLFQTIISLARPLEGIGKDTATYAFDGQEDANGKILKIVKATHKEGPELRYFFDAGTNVFNKIEYTVKLDKPAPDGSKEMKFKYSVVELGRNKFTQGYRAKTGEVYINGKKKGEYSIKSVTINEAMDDKLFEKPE